MLRRQKRGSANKRSSDIARPQTRLLICLLLAAAVWLVYWPTLGHGFVYDDQPYIVDNPVIHGGVTMKGFVWAFTSFYQSNWHPLAWLSHMLDCSLYGVRPMGHHLTNILLHMANTLLLFLLINRMTGALWRSAFAAALFGIHPLHVESVAWAAERKDVLSALFCILAMWAYTGYSKRPILPRYAMVFALFAAGLMAKPMLVTLPFALLLLDYWPLRRQRPLRRLIVEKIPLLALSAASSIVTYLAQQSAGSVAEFDRFSFGQRLANAAVAYVTYLGKTVCPTRLAVFYPHPGGALPVWLVIGSAAALLVMSLAALRTARSRPYLAVGWFWYLGTLVPVIGLLQVGSQSMADRYTYLPLTGLFIAVCWLVPDLLRRRSQRLTAGALAVLALAALTASARLQVSYWRDTISLFRHATGVTEDNVVAYNNLGAALGRAGRNEEAIRALSESLRIAPNAAKAHYNLAILQSRSGDREGAIAGYRKALAIDPAFRSARKNLAVQLYYNGEYAEAWRQVRLLRELGGEPHPAFLRLLSEKMPESSR